jgi:hypothetical protein
MTKERWFVCRALAVPALLALLTVPGCSGGEGSLPRSLEAAVVPGADFTLYVGYREARSSPAGGEFVRRNGGGEGSEQELRLQVLEKEAGVGREELEALYFTADLDGIDLDRIDDPAGAEKVDAVLAAAFSRPFNGGGLKAALETLAAGDPATRISTEEIAGREAIVVVSTGGAGGGVYTALSEDGKTVYATPNRRSLEGALTREGKKKPERVQAELAAVEQELPQGSQVKTALVIPPAMRAKIEERFAKAQMGTLENPGSALFISFAAPFSGIANLSGGAQFSEGLDVIFSADLGGPEQAQQAAAIFQTLALPLLKARMAKEAGRNPVAMDDRVAVASRGGVVQLSVKLTAEDIAALEFKP